MGISFIAVVAGYRDFYASRHLSCRNIQRNKTMAVEDDLRRLSEMQAIYLGWQSFIAHVTAGNTLNNLSPGERRSHQVNLDGPNGRETKIIPFSNHGHPYRVKDNAPSRSSASSETSGLRKSTLGS